MLYVFDRSMSRLLPSPYCCSRGALQRGEKKNEYDGEVSVEFSSYSATQQPEKNSVVRIVLAGGLEELYTGAVSARMVMRRYPWFYLARPEVFRRPHQSLVSPRERLLPGQKFYLLPPKTVEKLLTQKKADVTPARARALGIEAEPEEEKLAGDDSEEGEDAECCDGGYTICSAKGFYVSKEKWARCCVKRWERNGVDEQQQQPPPPPKQQQKKQQRQLPSPPSVPPPSLAPPLRLWSLRSRAGWLVRWKPNLSPVLELSP